MWKLIVMIACSFMLSGCLTSVADGRNYKGVDSTYTSKNSAVITAQCIKKEWQEVFASNPSAVWVTDKDVEGRYTVYLRDFIYLADVKDDRQGSLVTYYHNGDHLWGTKERLIAGIKRCL